MILINLLPYRDAIRRERKRLFFFAIGGSVAVGIGAVAVWFTALQEMSAAQEVRNQFLQQQVASLDRQIKDIGTLRAEIEELNSRRREVESLQTNRNQPVHLLGELVRQTPDGVHLTSVRQVADGITLSGVAQSNERVSELLRNLSRNATWLESPELLEIQAAAPAAAEGGAAATPTAVVPASRVFKFSLRVKIRRPGPSTNAPAALVKPA